MDSYDVKRNRAQTVSAGVTGGIVGGLAIWLYEAVVWVAAQHLMPLLGIPRNATGLAFGRNLRDALGPVAPILGAAIHFSFTCAWGALFAFLWPWIRRRGIEATLAALFYALVVWIVMHAAIMAVSSNHPNYYDANVIIGGLMSHFFCAAPLALIVKQRLAREAA